MPPTALAPRPTDRPPARPAVLRRQLGRLVYRDAAQAYGVGVALVVMPLLYLFREWPPWVIRDTLHGLPPLTRAAVIAGAHATYGLATLPVVRVLIGSERLRPWWSLPLGPRFWPALHLRHLVLLDAPWLLAIAYGVLPLAHRPGGGPLPALAAGLAFALLTLAGQIGLAAVADRRPPWAGAGLIAWAAAAALATLAPAPLALLVGVVAFAPARLRLGTPMPEASARRHGRAGGPAQLALVRLHGLAARRHEPVALSWGLGVQLGAVALVGLGIVHVGASEPAAAAALRRGLAVVAATVGAALGLLSVRALDGDRPQLDTWGIPDAHERRARVLLAAFGVAPALVAGTLVLPWLGPVGRGWVLDGLIATGWAATFTAHLTFARQARGRLHASWLLRHLLWMSLALVLTGAAGTSLVLLPWAGLSAWRLPAAQRRADRARRRYESARRDDHRS